MARGASSGKSHLPPAAAAAAVLGAPFVPGPPSLGCHPGPLFLPGPSLPRSRPCSPFLGTAFSGLHESVPFWACLLRHTTLTDTLLCLFVN